MVALKDGKQVGLLFPKNGIPMVVVVVPNSGGTCIGSDLAAKTAHHHRPHRHTIGELLASSSSKNVVGIDVSFSCQSTISHNQHCYYSVVTVCISLPFVHTLRAHRVTP
jgi:hypothetical protein